MFSTGAARGAGQKSRDAATMKHKAAYMRRHTIGSTLPEAGMGKLPPVVIRKSDDTQQIAGKLERLGDMSRMRIKNKDFDLSGVVAIHLRERNWSEAFDDFKHDVRDFFSGSMAHRQQRAGAVCRELESMMKDRKGSSQLLHNIRQRIEHKGSFSGQDIARDIANRNPHGKVLPLQGGQARAEGMGLGMHLLEMDALQVSADSTIVKLSTACQRPELEAQLDPHALGFESLGKPPGLSTQTLIAIQDDLGFDPDANWAGYQSRFERNLELALRECEGAVVIDVSDEMLDVGVSGVDAEQRRDAMVLSLLNKARKILNEKLINGEDMAITFACKDKQRLEMIRDNWEVLSGQSGGAGRIGAPNAKSKAQASPPEDGAGVF